VADNVRRKRPGFACFASGPDVTSLRPEALEILAACREQAREVILFTFSEASCAREISRAFGFGFAANQIFGCELFLFAERDRASTGILIEDKPVEHENAQLKMRTLGIDPARYFLIPSFHHPKFAPCRTFLAGLPFRLSRLASRRA